MSVLVFDIETIPDVESGRRLLDLDATLSDADVARAMATVHRRDSGSDFLPLYLHRIVSIAVVFANSERLRVYALNSEQAPDDERQLLERFFDGLTRFTPTLVSWNGAGFDLPVIHYRALLHGVAAPRYWDQGEDDREFRYNNYLNRYHTRHLDLMDVLSGYQLRAAAPLDGVAMLLGLPGKLGMDGSKVWDAYLAGDLAGICQYCETDVLNTYLVYLHFERMRGGLEPSGYEREIERVRQYLSEDPRPHLQSFLAAWAG